LVFDVEELAFANHVHDLDTSDQDSGTAKGFLISNLSQLAHSMSYFPHKLGLSQYGASPMTFNRIQFQRGMSTPEHPPSQRRRPVRRRLPRWGTRRRQGRARPENKVPFVAAVSLNDQGRPMYLEHSLVSGFTLNAIGKWAQAHLTPGTVMTSDGLACFAAVTNAKCVHVPMVVGDLQPRDLPEFKSVNTVLGNLKTTLAGTFHALKYRKYADHYLAAFAYRFNRHGPIVDVARCTPAKELIVRAHAEAGY
jgi:hypothetical protein